ncbi:hypothetical protein VaNZ11_000427 [Volvox africanus]|uniref:Uncharacterized protein n=1 Tax=Volvox africanus TaxID=51714 RepID=A0ABQ5RMY8_9CHLO|nr:hypothetical protein VaNZ11_000427 [Volvox africanus]
MEDDATADHLEPHGENESDAPLERASSGPFHTGAGKRRGDITLAELQEQFYLLQHQFELFQEGRTRPPTRARDEGSAPAPVPRERSRDIGGGPGPVAVASGPRSQSVPPGARMLRSPSPADSRHEQMRPRQPFAQQPPRASRPPAAVTTPSPPGAAPPRPRPAAAVLDRRLPSPPPLQNPRSVAKALPEVPAASGAAGINKTPEKKKVKKKVERPPWRDDFAGESSPWSRELAQEQAEAVAAVDSLATATGGTDNGSAAPVQATLNPGRGHSSRESEPWSRTRASSDGGDRDAPPSPKPGPVVALGEIQEGLPKGVLAPVRRRPQPTTAASVRAAAVAAAIEVGRQQQLLEQQLMEQQQGIRQQAARGGMLLVVSSGPGGTAVAHQGSPVELDAARTSPGRGSHIPSLPSPGSESRPRTQQSRIPTLPVQPEQQQQGHQNPVNGPRQLEPATTLALGDPLGDLGGGGVHRLVVDASVSSSFSNDDPLFSSTESSQTPASSTVSSAQQQRRRRQWAVPGAAVAGGGNIGHAADGVAGGARRASSSDGAADGAVAPAVLCGPPAGVTSPSAPAPGRAFNPTPPSSRPPSRPASRPASRPTSTTGDATAGASGHHHPNSSTAYAEEDARQHSSPERPTGHRISSTGGYHEARGGGILPASDLATPDLTFSAGISAGGCSEDSFSRRQTPPPGPPPGPSPTADAGSGGSFHLAAGAPVAFDRTAEIVLPAIANEADSGPHKAGMGRGPGPGPVGPRNKEEYFRKLSALKRSLPHDSMRRVTEDGGNHAGVSCSGGGWGGGGDSSSTGNGGGGSAGPSRKWMDPGSGDKPLSATPVDAVGSAPAAVRAARSRNLTADALQSNTVRGGDSSGGNDVLDAGEGTAGDPSGPARKPRPARGRSFQHQRSGSFGDAVAAGPSLGGAAEEPRISDSGQSARTAPQVPVQLPGVGSSPPHSPSRLSPHRVPRGIQPGAGPRAQPPPPQQQQQHVGGTAADASLGGAAPISAEQYMAFAVQYPEIAMAAAQAVMNTNGSRTRARWNVPPPQALEAAAAPQQQQPPQPGLAAAGATATPGGGPHLWPHQQHPPPLPPPPPPQQLAAAMVSANSLGIPAVPLLCSPSQAPQPRDPAQRPFPSGGDNSHDLRRANSEGPRMAMGRGAGVGMQDTVPTLAAPPTSAPSGSGPGGFGPPAGGPSGLFYGGAHPPQPPQQPPMVQGLFPSGSAGAAACWPGPGPGEGLPDGNGRLVGGAYTSAGQPARPAIAQTNEVWTGGPGPGPGPPSQVHPSGFPPPPPPQWNGYGYGPGVRPSGYAGLPGPGPGPMEPHGPLGHTGPLGDPYRPPIFKRVSNGHHDGFGAAGLGYASAPPIASGPGYGSGGGAAGGSDLPDYLRVSMSRMVAGWSAPNAKHGALSGFNDVWQHRNNSRPPAGPGVAAFSSGGSPAVPGGDVAVQARAASGGGGRETGFEGLSLAEVLASKPKKETPNFKKKT